MRLWREKKPGASAERRAGFSIHPLFPGAGRGRRSGAHHAHKVCADSGDVVEFCEERIEALQEEIARKHGYQRVDHRLILYVRPLRKKPRKRASAGRTQTDSAYAPAERKKARRKR